MSVFRKMTIRDIFRDKNIIDSIVRSSYQAGNSNFVCSGNPIKLSNRLISLYNALKDFVDCVEELYPFTDEPIEYLGIFDIDYASDCVMDFKAIQFLLDRELVNKNDKGKTKRKNNKKGIKK